MPVHAVHDRDELGDLDDFFWPYTTWYRRGEQVAPLYHGGVTPTLIALAAPEAADELAVLLRGLAPLLPRRQYAHLSPGGSEALADYFDVASGGTHRKLASTDPTRLAMARPACTSGRPSTGSLPWAT